MSALQVIPWNGRPGIDTGRKYSDDNRVEAFNSAFETRHLHTSFLASGVALRPLIPRFRA